MGHPAVGMPKPERATPTLSTAEVRLLVLGGSPEMEAPSGITPPPSAPLGPVPMAGAARDSFLDTIFKASGW